MWQKPTMINDGKCRQHSFNPGHFNMDFGNISMRTGINNRHFYSWYFGFCYSRKCTEVTKTVTMTLFYLRVPVSYDSEPTWTTWAVKWGLAISNFVFYAFDFPTVTCQNVLHEESPVVTPHYTFFLFSTVFDVNINQHNLNLNLI